MSYDYTDCFDLGDVPPEDPQYWFAPFVLDFLKKYENVLGMKCDISYLREKTGTQILWMDGDLIEKNRRQRNISQIVRMG